MGAEDKPGTACPSLFKKVGTLLSLRKPSWQTFGFNCQSDEASPILKHTNNVPPTLFRVWPLPPFESFELTP